jgi:serine/threonine-protein kinase
LPDSWIDTLAVIWTMLHLLATSPQGQRTATDSAERPNDGLPDRYRIIREIGRGGMSVVYLAQDRLANRDVAIKMLRPELALAGQLSRFIQEIAITARLDHPNILPLYDSGEAGDTLYYVMPYVEGGSLRRRLRDEHILSLAEVRRLATEIASALDYAHSCRITMGEGIVHRDIKPENVLLGPDNKVLLADFGIARVVSRADNETLTSYGLQLGTWPYMSPEQCTGDRKIDGRSDVYALGCVVYELLTGEPPFSGGTGQAIVAKHISQPPPSLRVVRPDLPESVDAAVTRALAKAPADRFPTAGEFASELSESRTRGLRRVAGRRRWAVVVGTAVVIGIGYVAFSSQLRSRPLNPRDWIVVADFQGPSEDPGIAPAVRELVTAELNQSRSIRTLPREQLISTMRLAGIKDTATVGTETAKELAVRTSVRAVVVGSIGRIGTNNYSVVVHVLDPESGRTLLSATRAAVDRGAELVQAVQALGRELRAGLGERTEDLQATRPLMQIATPSFAAFRKFATARDLESKGDYAGSNVVLREALAIDTAFASAWAQMGMNYLTNRNIDSAGLAFKEALKRPDRLTDARRYRLQADLAYAVEHDLPAAIRWYDRYLQLEPWSYPGHNNRALYLSSMGRDEEALAELDSALATNPVSRSAMQIELLNKTAALVILGRLPAAREVARDLQGPFAQYAQLLFAAATDQWVAAESLASGPARDPTVPSYLRIFSVTALASARTVRGATFDASALLDSAARASAPPLSRWYYQSEILLATTSGIPVGGVPAKLAGDTAAGGVVTRAMWAAVYGDTGTARRLQRSLSGRSHQEMNRLGDSPLVVDALIAAHASDEKSVVNKLAAAARRGEHDATLLDRPSSLFTRWLVASAYARMGRFDSAASYLELLLVPERMPPAHYALRGLMEPFARKQLAALRERHASIGRVPRSSVPLLWKPAVPNSNEMTSRNAGRAANLERSPSHGHGVNQHARAS